MERIGDWIRKVRLELEQALNDSGPVRSGLRLEADRITVTLQIDQNGLVGAAASGSPTNGGSATIEFKLCQPPNQPVPELNQEPPPPQAPDQTQGLMEEIVTAAFGAKGFDNSARAEVFCELVEGLPESEVLAALKIVAAGSQATPTSSLSYPVSRLRQILSFSPQGAESAAQRLSEVLEHTSINELIRILSQQWNFGTHWPQASQD